MAKKSYTVGQVNGYIKNLISSDYLLGDIYVKGEVSNCKYHSSGHIYFSLKDETGSIMAVMFKSYAYSGLDFKLENGQQVVCHGSVNIYERDGRYQLYVKEIKLDGIGNLYERYEQLKQKLYEQGLFEFDTGISEAGRHRDSTDRCGDPGYQKHRKEKKSICPAYPVSGKGTGRWGSRRYRAWNRSVG